jgi:phosphoribosylglycinamide formyltransferase-1
MEDDTAETLHARIQVQEHIAYPEALRLLSEGRLSVEKRCVRILAT